MASTYDSFSPQPAVNESPDSPSEQLQQATTPNVNTTAPSTTSADLSYKHSARGRSLNNPPPDGWIYPHKGIGTRSNLELFKAEIEARTQRGENCKAIADALNAMGVQTSDRAAQRKVKTPPCGSDAARLSVKSKVQAMRKSELIRMTREGMSAEEIYQNLTKRGMELKKGVATVLRLQSAWGLVHDEKRWLGNFRHQCHKKAKAQQFEAFSDIAKELGVQDVEAWTREKMSEEVARQTKHELALKLMGKHAPTDPQRRKLQTPRRTDGPYPYVKRTFTIGAAELSDSEASESDANSDAESPAPAKRPRPHVHNTSSRKGGAGKDSDGSSSEVGDDDGMPMDRPSCPDGMGMDMDTGYPPPNDQRDDGMHDAEGDYDETNSTAHTAARVFECVGQTTPQSTTAPRPIRMYDPQRPPAAAANSTLNLLSSTSQMASAAPRHLADSPISPSTCAVTPAERGKERSSKQSAGKQTLIPGLESPTSTQQTNMSPVPQFPTLSVMSHVLATEPATTSANPPPASSATAATSTASTMPPLVLRTGEAEAKKLTLSTLDQYNVAANVYKELLEARTENKSVPGSLTGLPPSAKEIDTAKHKLKEATQAMMLALG